MISEKRFSLKSLRTKIVLVVISVGLITTLSILLYQQKVLVRSITEAQEENGLNLVNTVALFVESQHQSILFHKQTSLDKRKDMLRSVLGLALVQVESAYDNMLSGVISEEEAKLQAIAALKKMRYDDGVGYLWINTIDRPIPRMIMHATIPELDGTVLDAPRFNCALGRSENLFRAMADVCLDKGRGYVDYLWPKPTDDGMTDEVPKLSYVELFEPWGWIVGTGLYTDDIEHDANERLAAVIKELQTSFSQVKVAQTGYMFLFTGEQEMLVHPYLEGADFSKLLNPDTGNPVLADLIEAAHTPSQRLLYTWDKPPEFEGQFEFEKMAFVYYFEPLDWYLASSVYSDETESTASEVRLRVMTLGLLILLVGVVISFWLSSGISRPLLRLTKAAKYIHSNSDLRNRVPVMGTIETKELGIVLNRMLASLQEEISERRQTELTLKDALQEKEVLLKEVHHRVKNNMAVVISMLNMQSKRVNNDQVRLALEESRSRISAMSLIHEALYRSDNLAEIPLEDYVSKVFNALQQAMVQVKGGVLFKMSGDQVNLPIDQAVPCGLVLNELITNSLKYGYPNGGPGVINLSAHLEDDNWLQLDYSDDGIGLPENYDPSVKNTLGMRIVKLLVENQLGGELKWITGPGAHFIIRWPTEFFENQE